MPWALEFLGKAPANQEGPRDHQVRGRGGAGQDRLPLAGAGGVGGLMKAGRPSVRRRSGAALVQVGVSCWCFSGWCSRPRRRRDAAAQPCGRFLPARSAGAAADLAGRPCRAGRAVASLATRAVTIVLGRVFCGWFCPLGTLHALAGRFLRVLLARSQAAGSLVAAGS